MGLHVARSCCSAGGAPWPVGCGPSPEGPSERLSPESHCLFVGLWGKAPGQVDPDTQARQTGRQQVQQAAELVRFPKTKVSCFALTPAEDPDQLEGAVDPWKKVLAARPSYKDPDITPARPETESLACASCEPKCMLRGQELAWAGLSPSVSEDAGAILGLCSAENL